MNLQIPSLAMNRIRSHTPVLLMLVLLLVLAYLSLVIMGYRMQVRQYEKQQVSSSPQFSSAYLSMPVDDFLIKLNSPENTNNKSFWGYPIISNEIIRGLVDRNPDDGFITNNSQVTLLMITQKGKSRAEETAVEFDRISLVNNLEVFDNTDLMGEEFLASIAKSGSVEKRTLNLGPLDTGEGRLIPLFISNYRGDGLESRKITGGIIYAPRVLSFNGVSDKKTSDTVPIKKILEVPSYISVFYIF